MTFQLSSLEKLGHNSQARAGVGFPDGLGDVMPLVHSSSAWRQ
jgi:hypothetical protein